MKRFDISVVGELNADLILYGLPATLELEREHLADDFAVTLGSSSAISLTTFHYWAAALVLLPASAAILLANSVRTVCKRAVWMCPA